MQLCLKRLRLDRFKEEDLEGLAAVLADPEVTRNITANASTPERCLAAAEKRIAWHTQSWSDHGYGVWALRLTQKRSSPPERIVGWCGFAPPDFEGEDPEILYGLARDCWGRGLATEAARGAITWLFEQTSVEKLSALIFQRLNPGSLRVAARLGMIRAGTMPYNDFMSNPELSMEVLDYEIWRLREGSCIDEDALLFQAPYKAGQLVSTEIAEPERVERALQQSAETRASYGNLEPSGLKRRVSEAFRLGFNEAYVERYRLTCSDWSSKLRIRSRTCRHSRG